MKTDTKMITRLNGAATQVDHSNMSILVSYQTPVAVRVFQGINGVHLFKTDKKWSTTTSRHINKWLNEAKVKLLSAEHCAKIIEIPQDKLEQLIETGVL